MQAAFKLFIRRTTCNGIICVIGLLFVVTSCKKKEPPPSPSPAKTVAEQISRAWKAKTVKHGASTVYTEGGPGNAVPGYSNFRLDLRNPNTATLKEVDNTTFTGTWQLVNDAKLVLNSLAPLPTGTNGTLEYTISETPIETELKLTRTATSTKTGNTINEYTLVPE
jgi:hypothetical protein